MKSKKIRLASKSDLYGEQGRMRGGGKRDSGNVETGRQGAKTSQIRRAGATPCCTQPERPVKPSLRVGFSSRKKLSIPFRVVRLWGIYENKKREKKTSAARRRWPRVKTEGKGRIRHCAQRACD